MGRYDILRQIERLDPERDCQEITRLTTTYDFPWDTTRSLELALYRTYAVPSISALLDQTGEFARRAQKRYDDTALLVAEFTERGYESERGKRALRRMNSIHHRYRIAHADFLYVLTTFVFEPIRWNARYGWRRLSDKERLATFYLWREIGRRMNIRDIPQTYAELEQYNIAYEREHFRYAATNRRVGEATRDLFLSWFPAPLRPLLTPGIYALMDEPLLDAFGFPHPPRWLRTLVASGLKLRARPTVLPAPQASTLLHGAAPADLSRRIRHRGAWAGTYRLAAKLIPSAPSAQMISTGICVGSWNETGSPNRKMTETMATAVRWPEVSMACVRGAFATSRRVCCRIVSVSTCAKCSS